MSLSAFPESEAQDLRWLERKIPLAADFLRRALSTVEDEGVSNYPLLVASQQEVEMGLPLLEDGAWQLRLSTLEEAYVKKLIEAERVDAFKELFKMRKEAHACVLWIGVEEMRWLFVPWD